MSESKLMLHCGSQEVTATELATYRAPEPQGRWFPVAHSRVLDVVSSTLNDAGYQIQRQQLGVMRDGSRFFGTLDLSAQLTPGTKLSVGIRNSIDKSFPLGFVAGNRVFVCDNLSFRSELLVRRKHTVHGERDFGRRIFEAVASLETFREQEAQRIERLRTFELTDDRADALMLRSYEKGVLGSRELPAVIREWRCPSFEDFQPRTAWSLLNAFTTALKERATRQPQLHAVATMRLQVLLDPEHN